MHVGQRAKRLANQGGEARRPVDVWSDEGPEGWSTPERRVSPTSRRWGSREGLSASKPTEAAVFSPQ